jgi:hypothetical protein
MPTASRKTRGKRSASINAVAAGSTIKANTGSAPMELIEIEVATARVRKRS